MVRDDLPILVADSSGGEDRLREDGSAADCTFKSRGSFIKTTSFAARALVACRNASIFCQPRGLLGPGLWGSRPFELIPTEAIERRQAKRIRELALRFSGFMKEARERTEPKKKPVHVGKLAGIEECEKHDVT
jgi:hypothetical protein